MISNNQTEVKEYKNEDFTHFAGVKFETGIRFYFFGTNDDTLKIGDSVVVETLRGVELGFITLAPIPMEKYTSELGLKPILRSATDADKKAYEANRKSAGFAMEICRAEVKKLNLDMRLLSCEYTLDKTKVIFSYLSDDRVDFRELLKVLAAKLHTRIELRQIGARDKAKMVGGLGVCGLPLCCSTFLNEFDGISINRAKNQLLAINIPKLSGACGKLFCCLKYEDDAYTELKKDFPEIGTKFFMDKIQFTVSSINIISKTVEIRNEETIQNISLEEFNNLNKTIKNRKDKDEKKQIVQ
ncbi:MAG: stage 0 sporulation family protein [Bacilli bacterium]